MNNKIFIDSSVFIENFKGNLKAKSILEESISKFEVYINGIVFSEVLFKVLGIKTGKSPITLKSRKQIPKSIKNLENYSNLLLLFNVLGENSDILRLSIEFMQRYSLLTNDAIILATCKYYNIENLVSLDSDFTEASEKEKILLVNDVNILKQI